MIKLLKELVKFNLRQVLFCGLLMLGLSIFEGASIAAIFPILELTGNNPTHHSSLILTIGNSLGVSHLSLGTEHLNGMKEVKCYGLEQQQLEELVNSRVRLEGNYIDFSRQQSSLDNIFLFNASLRENLLCSSKSNVSDNEIWQVLQLIQLTKLVQKLPRQLDSLVGDRGVQLSGGERQRLVLARALLRKPQFLILDEATSSLDQQNELLIQSALELNK